MAGSGGDPDSIAKAGQRQVSSTPRLSCEERQKERPKGIELSRPARASLHRGKANTRLAGLARSSCSGDPPSRAYQGGATLNIEISEGAHGPTNQAPRAMAAAISTGFCRGEWSSIVD